MRVWVDLTNSPHVLVMRPLIEVMRADGHEVEVTARDFAQTLELCARFGIEHTAIGRHRGGRLASKAVGLASRSLALARWARRRRFDVAMGHGSNDVTVAAAMLRIPSATMFDYEWATVQHQVNCRLARSVVVPDAIPPERLERYGARGKIQPTRGSRRSTTSRTSSRTRPCWASSASTGSGRWWSCARRPTCRCTTASRTRCSDECSTAWRPGGADRRAPAHPGPAAELGAFIVPEHAIDAQSLVAYADLVISAGGTMNREAVALGTPVFTTFEGRLGAVDEALLREGRLRKLEDPGQIQIEPPARERELARPPGSETNSSQCSSPRANHEISALVSERAPRRSGRRRRGPGRARLLARVRAALRPGHPGALQRPAVADDRVRDRRQGGDLRRLRPLPEVVALRRPARLRVDPEGGRGREPRDGRRAVRVVADRQRPAALDRRDGPAADARADRRRARFAVRSVLERPPRGTVLPKGRRC